MFVTVVALVTMAANCKPQPPEPPDPPQPPDPSTIIDAKYDVPCDGATLSVSLEASADWTAYVEGGDDWCVTDKTSGGAGAAVITITVYPNYSLQGRSSTVFIKVGEASGKIVIDQAQRNVLQAEPESFEIESEGGTVTTEVTANIDYEVIVSDEWLAWDNGTITVAENTAEEERTATVTLAGDGLSCIVSVIQAGAEPYIDPYDGIAIVLQSHTEGTGIPLVLMGDAFDTEHFEDGSYASLMESAMEQFFSIEPYTTFRNMFDVYMVNVVSPYYEDFESGTSTTLKSFFQSGTYVGADLDKCEEYALKAIGAEDLNRSLVIVMLNREYHAGRCYMSFRHVDDDPSCTYAQGVAFALCALGTDGEDFSSLIRHEAGGHGFGKLADEYFYPGMGEMPGETVELYRSLQTLSRAYLNVDFTGDAEAVRWSHFLTDERYAFDQVGIFEGGCNYETGVWRPSETGMMRDNAGRYNAPSREAIYYRLHKLAYGDEWEYDFEQFAEYDAISRLTDSEEPQPEPEPEPEPTGRPRRRWRGAEPCPPPAIIIK